MSGTPDQRPDPMDAIRRARPKPTPRLILYALVDAVGVALLAAGGAFLWIGNPIFFRSFPSTTAEAWGAVLLGIALMFWAVVKMIRERIRQTNAMHGKAQ